MFPVAGLQTQGLLRRQLDHDALDDRLLHHARWRGRCDRVTTPALHHHVIVRGGARGPC